MIYVGIPVIHKTKELEQMTQNAIASLITKEHMHVRVYDGEDGLSKKWNTFLGEAVELDCDYAWIINNDTLARSDTLDNMHRFIEQDEEGYIAFSVDQRKDMSSFRMWRNIDEPIHRATEEWFNWSYWVCRPSEFVYKAGLFDENIGMGAYQDVDKALEIRSKGMRMCRYLGSCIYHISDATRKAGVIKNLAELNERNKLYVENKWNVKL